MASAVQVGFERTMVQDVGFGIRRLVDIANTALSPAINDPYTGVQAVQHLSVLLCRLARLRLGDWTVHDPQGELRVAVPRIRNVHLVLDDARRATAQPADVEAIAAEAATALHLLGERVRPAGAGN